MTTNSIPRIRALIRQLARDNGAMIHINNDPDDALVGADAVYVKSWGSVKHYNHPEEEAAMRAGLRDWRLTGSAAQVDARWQGHRDALPPGAPECRAR